MKQKAIHTREYREAMLKDPYRPTYHFAVPDDDGHPGDPNGAFFVDGLYHLMYLYKNSKTNAFHWGHMTSTDMLHWRHLPDAIFSDEGDEGCFSGGGFVDEDKTAYITFWKFPSKVEGGDNGGIAIAYSKPPYEKWERIKPIAINGSPEKWGTMDIEINGKVEHLACADPSNIWKKDGYYYMQTGNLCVLDAYGRNEDSDPHYQGDWTDLFRSKDMKNWEYIHRFYINPKTDADWPDKTEDDMCPSFLPLFDAKKNGKFTGKYLQLFIAHNRGCQYYIGTLEGETFIPETHGRMSWNDDSYFAPEALVDDKNRHVMWVWMRDDLKDNFEKYGWSGVFSFPRALWLEDGILKMAPIDEIDTISYNKKAVTPDGNNEIKANNGEVFRIKAQITPQNEEKCGFGIRIDKESGNRTDIYYDAKNKKLVFDASLSGIGDRTIKEEAPFELKENETLSLDIMVDKCMVEVYANNRQAICRRVYPQNPEKAIGIEYIGNKDNIEKLEIFDVAATNPY